MPKEKDHHPGTGAKRKISKGKTRAGLTLSLYVNKRTGETSIKLIDNKTLEVIKEIHPQQLDIKGQIDDLAGALFNKKA